MFWKQNSKNKKWFKYPLELFLSFRLCFARLCASSSALNWQQFLNDNSRNLSLNKLGFDRPSWLPLHALNNLLGSRGKLSLTLLNISKKLFLLLLSLTKLLSRKLCFLGLNLRIISATLNITQSFNSALALNHNTHTITRTSDFLNLRKHILARQTIRFHLGNLDNLFNLDICN